MIAILAAAWAQVHANGHTGMGIGGPRPHGPAFRRNALMPISAKAIKKPQPRSNMSASINYLYTKSRDRREVP